MVQLKCVFGKTRWWKIEMNFRLLAADEKIPEKTPSTRFIHLNPFEWKCEQTPALRKFNV